MAKFGEGGAKIAQGGAKKILRASRANITRYAREFFVPFFKIFLFLKILPPPG